MNITLAVTAKNEEAAIAACLRSVIDSIHFAESNSDCRYDLVVILDDCTDETANIASAFSEARVIISRDGLVEAQRKVADQKPFVIYSDADILVEKETVYEISQAMLQCPDLRVAYPLKIPIPPERSTLLGNALFSYNRNDGFETRRNYFNGKFFAIRDWHIPGRDELSDRIRSLGEHRFYHYEAGIRADDIFLSKSILAESGEKAIAEISTATIHYRPAATLEGMYRYYRRMRMELERVPALCPELAAKNKNYSARRIDWYRLLHAPISDQLNWVVFQRMFRFCKLRYCLERFYYTYFPSKICPFWPPVSETKNLTSDNGR